MHKGKKMLKIAKVAVIVSIFVIFVAAYPPIDNNETLDGKFLFIYFFLTELWTIFLEVSSV